MMKQKKQYFPGTYTNSFKLFTCLYDCTNTFECDPNPYREGLAYSPSEKSAAQMIDVCLMTLILLEAIHVWEIHETHYFHVVLWTHGSYEALV